MKSQKDRIIEQSKGKTIKMSDWSVYTDTKTMVKIKYGNRHNYGYNFLKIEP